MISARILIVTLGFFLNINPVIASRFHPTKVGITETDLFFIGKNINQFQLKQGRYPQTDEELFNALNDGEYFQLQHEPEQHDGIYILLPIEDPWQQAYRYAFPGKHNHNTFDVLSIGQDGLLGTPDDVNNWDETHLWRTAYQPGLLERWWERLFWVWSDHAPFIWFFWLLVGLNFLIDWLAAKRKNKVIKD